MSEQSTERCAEMVPMRNASMRLATDQNGQVIGVEITCLILRDQIADLTPFAAEMALSVLAEAGHGQ